MSFLKKLGTIVLKIIGVASGLMPLIQGSLTGGAAATVSTFEDKLNKALGVIVTAEQMFAAAHDAASGKGSDKLKAATPFVAALIQNTELLIGKKPKDEAKFEAASTALTSALADILNSYGD